MEGVEGVFNAYFNEFPDWDEFPKKGETIYSDSRIFEFEFTDGFFMYTVKVLINVKYKRWFWPLSNFNPEEDEITDHEFTIECIKGYREFGGNKMDLNNTELSQIEEMLKDKIKILD